MTRETVRYWKFAAFLTCLLCSPHAGAVDKKIEQDKVEVAMALQLLGFVEWPEEAGYVAAREIAIGVFEDSALHDEFKALAASSRFRVILIDGDSSLELLSSLDAIIVNGEERASVGQLLTRLQGFPVLLIGSFDGFLEMGGMVNFVKKQKRMTFEISLEHSNRVGIGYRAKLLRLANRVVEK